MPHIIVEYAKQLENDTQVDVILTTIHRSIAESVKKGTDLFNFTENKSVLINLSKVPLGRSTMLISTTRTVKC